jgi:nitrilase
MPLLRYAMYAKGVQVYCAPTVDSRETWQLSMRHIAQEGRCFVVSAVQYQPSPRALGVEVPDWDPEQPLMRGGSLIVGPLGEVLAGPLVGEEGLVSASIDLDDLVEARYDLDVVGHYARSDVFTLQVDERAKPAASFER